MIFNLDTYSSEKMNQTLKTLLRMRNPKDRKHRENIYTFGTARLSFDSSKAGAAFVFRDVISSEPKGMLEYIN